MTTRTAERADFLSLVVITAVEGGINYWAETDRYKWNEQSGNFKDASVVVRDLEGNLPAEWTPVTLETIEAGLSNIRKDTNSQSYLIPSILNADRTNDAGNIDADAADFIVQYGLFGKAVYG